MKLLHLDIETFPHLVYSWGLFKQNISIDKIVQSGRTASWAAKWHGKKKIFFSGLNKDTEEEMITKIWEMINEADVVCHYNGTKFDMPTLNKEFVKFGLEPPSSYLQIDLLHTAKKQFRLASNKLDYLSQYLNVGKKVPHMGFELWQRCMQNEPKAWKLMEKYNRQDVALLEEVYNALLPWIKNHPNMGLFQESKDSPVCPTCGGTHLQKRGTYRTKTQSYQRYQCQDCMSWSRARTTNLSAQDRKNILTGI